MESRVLTLCVFDEQANVMAAYQTFWYGRVWIYGTEFDWLQFEASGVFRGHVSGQSGTTVELPATPVIWTLTRQALASAGQWMAKICLYEFDGGESIPPDNLRLLGMTRGQIVSASNSPITTLRLELGTGISPVAGSVPWRTATNRLIGPGIRG